MRKKGENHPQWKGNRSSYNAFHIWIRNNFGKAVHCDIDANHKSTRYHWANLTGDYRNINDYVQLCPHCHSLFDLGKLTIKGITKQGWFNPEYKSIHNGGVR
jgi:hypothetical protein